LHRQTGTCAGRKTRTPVHSAQPMHREKRRLVLTHLGSAEMSAGRDAKLLAEISSCWSCFRHPSANTSTGDKLL